MSDVRVTPWQEDDVPAPPTELLAGMRGRRPGGELIGIDRVLLKSFPLATGWNGLLGRVRAEFDLSLEYRELVMLRVAVLNRADFEWGVHYPAYLQAGGTEEKCEALKEPTAADNALFDKEECALLTLTDQSTKQVEVDAALIEELKRLFGEQQTVEAVATVAAYNMVSRFLVALAV
ncbi:carboxymuconolactone decarboxylase family protein [Streptomyces olivaceus]|uniref:carboxymuconolactone decarboxylase family protein n=1 Tax=Streptomyces olivaceus TaxID=47716 RepID=UPI0018A87E63|nr:carboxymuconolactone decarboxylase family protein [Streptomyces olivaceus]MBF8173740.1 carboxymuconolactone decarboxylase family protein [Streptomyces olivaceus]GHI94442.1 carboxymuconolactone decarboxylase [Streptomyces olivaceus]